MKILVTGGAGYCGSFATRDLLAAGHEVVVFDNLYQGHREAVPADVAFVKGDLRDADGVARLFAEHKGFDAIMHFASFTLAGESMQQPLMYLRDNLVAGANLLEQAVVHGVGRFILSSTANLFDDPARLPIEPDERIVPGSPYGESKFFLERLLHWFERIYGLRYVSLRYFNAAGGTSDLGEHHDPEQHFIPVVLQVALGQRESVTIFGSDYPTKNGTCVRDYIHVGDLAQAHILALESLDRLGSRVYNLGNGSGFTNLEVVEAARAVTGHPIPCTIGPRRPGDPAILVASADKIRAELGWRPRYHTLEQIIGSAWEWHRSHPNGYSE
ncbi:MAG TPA: UDP-glucose 4-epimerase GalE [Roseiflexaceae bacterium]|nr:UDP-glucose 4-epimerase GalE [Roseiflexaceae bacterium]